MRRRGVNYDVGVSYDIGNERGGLVVTHPTFDSQCVHRELEIIQQDLHCNAIRISGRSIERLMLATEAALKQGLEVWLSPLLYDQDEQETLDYIRECAMEAERLRSFFPQLIFILGCELTLFMQGIVEGKNIIERLPALKSVVKTGAHNKPLNAFLAKANQTVRQVFSGAVTYASAPLEQVDWSLFDFVCADVYREKRIKEVYSNLITSYFAHNKPVIITEFGCCTYRGAEDVGGMGWAILDETIMPVEQLKGDYVRDERLQAREITDLLGILDGTGVNGAFVYIFHFPALVHHESDPRRDLDMASYGLVKSYADGRHGASYPDMPWEPKESFKAVADYYAAH
ncbi:abortive infection protein [Ktedonospora formicarum]|uniref:Abortive infection protein n=1 Tax=Ktedonospora formicarum TaxID=2778364 RepID=A0A8J3I6D5_9CHLR|nr:abortive infection protein [Ktedonospora formicarum]GHO46912.1 hypothetical protein KSX_50750 [Ktedonospora formicarum]